MAANRAIKAIRPLLMSAGLSDSADAAPTTAVLPVDGGKVRSPEAGPDGLEWFDGRVGIIAPADAGSRGSTFYVGGVPEPDELFRRLLAGRRSAPATGRRALFIAEGAEWIRGRASLVFPGARQVLDIYHAAEHVASAAAAAWGEQSARATRRRHRAREMLLRPGGPAQIIAALCTVLDEGTPVEPKALVRALPYRGAPRSVPIWRASVATPRPFGCAGCPSSPGSR